MFCWGRREKDPNEPKAQKKLEKKKETIMTGFEVEKIKPKEKEVVIAPLKNQQKPTFVKNDSDMLTVGKPFPKPKEVQPEATQFTLPPPELSEFQNGCQLILFNAAQNHEIFLSLTVTKTTMNSSKTQSQDTLIHETLCNRLRNSTTLVILQHRDDALSNKYRQLHPDMLFLVVSQQHHYLSKITTRSRFTNQVSNMEDEEPPRKNRARLGSYASSHLTSSIVSSQSSHRDPSPNKQQTHHMQYVVSSSPNQLRLSFFQNILVWISTPKDTSITQSTKSWVDTVINGIHSLLNIQKTQIVLPVECELFDILDFLQLLIHDKIKNQPLEISCATVHFQLECIYVDGHLNKAIVRKRYEEGDMTIMFLAMTLFLLHLDSSTQQFYTTVLTTLKKITIKEYMMMKMSLREGHYNKRAILKVLTEHKLFTEDQLKLLDRFNEMRRIEDPWQWEPKYRFKVLKEMRLEIGRFLSSRVTVEPVISQPQPVQSSTLSCVQSSPSVTQQQVLIPSFKEDLEKDKAEQLRIIMAPLEFYIDLGDDEQEEFRIEAGKSDQINNRMSPERQSKRGCADDCQLQSPRRINRRKHSHEY